MKYREILMRAFFGGSSGGGGGYPEPSGKKTIHITENGISTEDVKNYAEAEIDVYVTPDLVPLEVTENGKQYKPEAGTDGFSSVLVNVPVTPEPSGTAVLNYTENGTFNETVKDYEFAEITVDVPEPSGTVKRTYSDNGYYTINVKNYETAGISVAVPKGMKFFDGVNCDTTPELGAEVTVRQYDDFDASFNDKILCTTNTEPALWFLGTVRNVSGNEMTVQVEQMPDGGGAGSDITKALVTGNVPAYGLRYTLAKTSEEDDLGVRQYAFAGFDTQYEAILDLGEASIDKYAFANSHFGKLTITGNLGTVESAAFENCKADSKAPLLLTSADTMSYGQFQGCDAFSYIRFGENLNYIGQKVFKNADCDVVLDVGNVPALANVNAFEGHNGSVYVPDWLLSSFTDATNWSEISGKIRSMDEFSENNYSTD